MKNKFINYLVLILLTVMFFLRMIRRSLFFKINNMLMILGAFLLIISSFYFTIKLKLLQFNVIKMLKIIRKSNKDDIRALFMSMGAKIGVGSIAGIGLAIYIGGPGVLLWIWIISLLSSILTYCESYLGLKYRDKLSIGGVFYYIMNGLSNRNLSIIYTLILIFVYAAGFVGIQSNTIVKSVTCVFDVNRYLIIGLVMFVVSIIIFNKLSSIIDFMSKLVPFMCLLYLILGLAILIGSKENIGDIFIIVVKDGVSLDKSLLAVIILGMQRGMFATESGIGTSSITSSISSDVAEVQALFQVIGVHFISLVIVTITGFIIIGSNYSYIGNVNGIEIVLDIFNNYYGFLGIMGLCLIIILFAISTIISGYYYGIKGIEFLKGRVDRLDYFSLKLFIILLVFLGGIVDSTIIWSLIDSLILFLLFINIYALVKLKGEIK